MPRTPARLTVLLGILTASAVAAWSPDYAWHDPVTNTPSQGAKPGGGGLYATGSTYEGGVKCNNCHLPRPGTGAPLDVRITFNPPLSGGRYARSTRYTITADMLNEHNLSATQGPKANNFAAMLEDSAGNIVGTLESDSGQTQSSCPATLPTLPASGTTLLYGDCHGILGRFVDDPSHIQWVFYWTSPATDVGPITLYYGAVDGNGNDRTTQPGGGPDDDVKMGSVTLAP